MFSLPFWVLGIPPPAAHNTLSFIGLRFTLKQVRVNDIYRDARDVGVINYLKFN